MLYGPDPAELHPLKGLPRTGFLKNFVHVPDIIVGDYTYYDDPAAGPEQFFKNVLYHFRGDKLIIGKFCAIAAEVKFIMNGGNHPLSGISTYPFSLFGNGWEAVQPQKTDQSYKGDTVIGNDVWIGYNAVIMSGVKIGDGAIIATRAVVTNDVAPYTIVGGTPARVIRQRFPDDTVKRLQAIAWWDWPAEKITRALPLIAGADVSALEAIARDR